ncbi:MAG TPA: hypothetical protein PLA13_03930 [Microbacteriaceae bacterium]|nr:hypothetical protein [Microbacteriaceae bacterium]HQX35487.1 hypothetical protein [Microbacteriaceae bacterium]HQZ48358.1 hypothetical protein [Microbacteriaceae bacterium]HRA09527.1 hypothetical protein [Microbacteriaceae bacterium]
MGGQVLGGGVIVLVAVLLWLVYLLPSWHARHQFNAAERNAVRLNQAIRIFAETSETPDEVRLELNARTAMTQQRLAKRMQAEREQAANETLREQLAVARFAPAARMARARRRTRLAATTTLIIALVLMGLGVWQFVAAGAQLLLWVGGALVLVSGVALQRMASVSARAATRAVTVDAVAPSASTLHDIELPVTARDTSWTPRALPQQLVASAGSRAAAVQDALDAQRRLREAAQAEAMRERAAQLRPAPVSIETARIAPVEPATPAAPSKWASMGVVDDAEIEAHVRQLLARRSG